MPRGGAIVAALRFYIETAQAQQLCFVAPGHLSKCTLGRGSIARHLGRLRGEQLRERISGRQTCRLVGGFTRELQIPGPDCDQTAADRQIAFDRAPVPEKQRYLLGRSQNTAHDRPQQRDYEHEYGDRKGGKQHRRFEAVAQPGNCNFARTIGDPGKAGGNDRDRRQKKNDADHPNLIACPARAWRRQRVDARQ
jgi:hypothetical protein